MAKSCGAPQPGVESFSYPSRAPEQFRVLIASETVKWGGVVRAAKIQAE